MLGTIIYIYIYIYISISISIWLSLYPYSVYKWGFPTAILVCWRVYIPTVSEINLGIPFWWSTNGWVKSHEYHLDELSSPHWDVTGMMVKQGEWFSAIFRSVMHYNSARTGNCLVYGRISIFRIIYIDGYIFFFRDQGHSIPAICYSCFRIDDPVQNVLSVQS